MHENLPAHAPVDVPVNALVDVIPPREFNILDLDHNSVAKAEGVVASNDEFDFFEDKPNESLKKQVVPILESKKDNIDTLDFDFEGNSNVKTVQKVETKKQGLFDLKSMSVKKAVSVKINMDFEYVDMDPGQFQENWETFKCTFFKK